MQIHSIGLDEVSTIMKKASQTIQSLGYNMSIPKFTKYLENDKLQKFSSAEDVRKYYYSALNKVNRHLHEILHKDDISGNQMNNPFFHPLPSTCRSYEKA